MISSNDSSRRADYFKKANKKLSSNSTRNQKVSAYQFLKKSSNSKLIDWITVANQLKDFINNNKLWIEKKYKTEYKIANIIINSNNSKTIWLDRNDQRYFISDILEKYIKNGIEMKSYYGSFDKAVKNLEVRKALYSYILEYVKLNLNFNELKFL